MASPRVLLAEDDPVSQRVVARLLQQIGCRVDVVGDGQAAIEAVVGRGFGRDRYSLVLMDCQMPVMDGRTFYRELRARGHSMPVIILSAFNAERAGEELGAQAAMNKPFSPDAIVAMAAELLERRPSAKR